MPNDYFKFKQFTVHQDKCAMKVCTDACLFGGYVADTFRGSASASRVLDIGTGTGLLSLMLAQKNVSATIDAIEIDGNAAAQAVENFSASPWKERMNLTHLPVQEFVSPHRYDLIISNPPFFENDLKSVDAKRNLALHSTALGLDDLLDIVVKYLAADGMFAVLLPYHRSANFINHALLKDLYLHEQVSVKQTPAHSYFRTMLLFGKEKKTATYLEWCIKEGNDVYSKEFVALLKDYYLYL